MAETGAHARNGRDWRPYCVTLLAAVVLGLAATALLILVANPYGNLPFALLGHHAIMDTNQRFQYPAIARSQEFDSLVVGTSTSRLLRPETLAAKFGGKFANLAMDSGMAWEQYRMASFFAHAVPQPRTLIVGLDHVWCDADAGVRRITGRGFPEWMFDDTPWNDLPWLLNMRAAEISIRRVGLALGLREARIPFDGYEVFLPPEDKYDLAKVKALLHTPDAAPREPYRPSSEERQTWTYPALAWLDELLGQNWQRVILLITPIHAGSQPASGSRDAAKEAECKARMADIAQSHNVPLVDFRIASPITTEDANYWDPLHYRVAIAERIVDGLARAVETGRDDPGGDYKVLSKSR